MTNMVREFSRIEYAFRTGASLPDLEDELQDGDHDAVSVSEWERDEINYENDEIDLMLLRSSGVGGRCRTDGITDGQSDEGVGALGRRCVETSERWGVGD